MSRDQIAFLCLALAALGYLWFVNRRFQRYRGEAAFDAPIEEVWDLVEVRPDETPWLANVKEIVPVAGAPGEVAYVFTAGHEMRTKVLACERPRLIETANRYRWRGATDWGDRVWMRVTCEPQDQGERTLMRCDYLIERAALANGFLPRLNYPMLTWLTAMMMRRELARRHSPAARPPQRAKAPPFTIVQLALMLGALVSLTAMFGIALGLAFLAYVIVHEYGHVWAMRRHGHEAARFYLLPFLGGVAVGSRACLTDAESVTITLMGPVFGTAPGLVFLAAHATTGAVWAAAAGLLLLFVNLLNLAPCPPLDGGRIAQTLLRPFGPRVWFVASGVLILAGVGLALLLESLVLLALFGLAAFFWSRAPSPPDRTPLALRQWAAVFLAYAGLILLHVGLMAHVLSVASLEELGNVIREL